jgi:tetratricopeptide (TPR) repeat protein
MQQELGHRHAEAITSASLGYAEHNLGDSASAVRRYEHALRLLRELGDRYNEATVLDCAGDGHHAAGDAQAARRAWQDALAILEGLHHPDAGALRAKLGRGRVPDSQAVARAPAPGAFIP